jgi:uncharacterized protein (DUF1697 family)
MAVVISMLRGINLGTHNRIKMEDLRNLCDSLKLRNAQTYVQSGNVVFRTNEKDLVKLARRMEQGIERSFGFRTDNILRTPAEMRDVITRSPFAGRPNLDPAKLLVSFLASEPSADARDQVLKLRPEPEEMHLLGREIYIYFPDGIGRSKLSWVKMEKMLKTPATARNWNSVTKLLEMAEIMEAS